MFTWQRKLADLKALSVMVVGIGNPQRMDDGIGVWIANQLQQKSLANLRAVAVGLTPEDALPLILDWHPSAVIMVDALNCGCVPGTIRLFEGDELPEFCLSTHAIPLPVVGKIIRKMASCSLYYLGIQVGDTGFGAAISAPVHKAGQQIVNFF